jgi:hypothetical protein
VQLNFQRAENLQKCLFGKFFLVYIILFLWYNAPICLHRGYFDEVCAI